MKMKMKAVTQCFSTWMELVAEAKRMKTLLKRAAMKIKYKTVALVLTAWIGMVNEKKRYKLLLKRGNENEDESCICSVF